MPNVSSTRCKNDTTVESNPLHNKIEHSQIHNETEMGSDFSDKINCLPNQRGFKMAFLNIVSLPKRFDEINLTMSNKLLDIMSFQRRVEALPSMHCNH
jgi:hypothetical protein